MPSLYVQGNTLEKTLFNTTLKAQYVTWVKVSVKFMKCK